MPEYAYKGHSIQGPVQGNITAVSRKIAQKTLRAQGIAPKTLEHTRLHKEPIFWIFIQTLSILVTQNIKLSEALVIMRKQRNQNVRDAARRILAKLGDGVPFPTALPQVFRNLNPQTLQLIDIGSRNAGLSQAIKVIKDERDFATKQKQDLTKALSYPAFVLLFSVVALIVIFDTVLPEFKTLLQDTQLTPLQNIIMGAAGNGYNWFIAFFWAILAVTIVVYVVSLHRPSIMRLARIFDHVPGLGHALRVSSQAQFLHALALALHLKSDLSAACVMAARYVKNPYHQYKLLGIKTGLLEGQLFRLTLSQTNLFNDMQLALIEIAERSNKLGEVVLDIDQTLRTERAHRMSLVSQIIGPFAIIILGIIIFMVAFVVVTPMMSLQNSIG